MKGEFKGDFSRDTFDPSKHFLRVAMQQGRVSLDADWNEQMDILLHYMQTLAKDIIGPYAGPAGKDLGFGITPSEKDFKIGQGRYYVDGILCENEEVIPCGVSVGAGPIGYYRQLDYPVDKKDFPLPDNTEDFPLLVYLDVWERHISSAEDDYIREKALGGPDTASRSKVVWQVKTRKKAEWLEIVSPNGDLMDICIKVRQEVNWPNLIKTLQPLHRGCLKARANMSSDETDPCIASPEARYRGEENQLYRVEIHRGGKAGVATFKWSRDNGSVIFPVLNITDNKNIMLEHLGRDDRLSLKVGDWVEVMDDAYTLRILSRPTPLTGPRQLAQVDEVDLAEMRVTLKLKENDVLPTYENIKDKHPFLRRWDYQEPDLTKEDEPKFAEDKGFSALLVVEGSCEEDDGWLTLEDGVQICFLPSPDQGNPNMYQAGDYWMIPARTATGDVEWPYEIIKVDQKEAKRSLALPPHGIDHHYAPLAVLKSWNPIDLTDCRCEIKTTCYPPTSPAHAKKGRPAREVER